jgi:hypothetical protein
MNQTIKVSFAIGVFSFFSIALPCFFGEELGLVLVIFFLFPTTIIGAALWVTPRQAEHRMTTEEQNTEDEIKRCRKEEERSTWTPRRSFYRARADGQTRKLDELRKRGTQYPFPCCSSLAVDKSSKRRQASTHH